MIEYTIRHTSRDILFKLYFSLIYGDGSLLKSIIKVAEGNTSFVNRVYLDGNNFFQTWIGTKLSNAIVGNALLGGI